MKTQENIKFEDALKKLEDTVRALESGTLSLDESINKYKEAMTFVKLCNDRLNEAEKVVKILVEDDDGAVYDAPFADDEA